MSKNIESINTNIINYNILCLKYNNNHLFALLHLTFKNIYDGKRFNNRF